MGIVVNLDKDTTQAFELAAQPYEAKTAPAVVTTTVGMKLHLGVIDLPYMQPPTVKKVAKAKRGRKNRPTTSQPGTQSTGDVAQWLENKYDVMQGFFDLHEKEIVHSLENSIAGALESLVMGAPPSLDPFGTAMGEIEKTFKFKYIENEEITSTGASGVPTQAALDGVNHRLKGGRGARRPSFIDTGLYQSSFRAWIK